MRTPEEMYPVSPAGIPGLIAQTLATQQIAVGILEEKWYRKGLLDSVLKELDQPEGVEIEPFSNVLLHIYPQEPIGDFDNYLAFADQVTGAIGDLFPTVPDIYTGTVILPTCSYSEDEQPTILHLGNIDLMHQPLPTFLSLGTVIVYPSREIALRYIDILDRKKKKYSDLDPLKPLDFPIAWDVLGDFEEPTIKNEYQEKQPQKFSLRRLVLDNLSGGIRRLFGRRSTTNL